MINVVESGNKYSFFNEVNVLKALPVANYQLFWDMRGNCHLMKAPPFTMPAKIYDFDKDFRETVLKSFNHHNTSTGVLLEGYKGQGKSVTAKLIANESKLPVIMINNKIPNEVDFVNFLAGIQQEYVLFVDEFEKLFGTNYSTHESDRDPVHHQDVFLPLMDGAVSATHKRLYLFTTNTSINDKFLNRPSRIRFYKTYQFMDRDLFDTMVDDLLNDKKFKDDLVATLPLQDATVDLVISIIKEINLLGIPYSHFKNIYNHRSSTDSFDLFYKDENEQWKAIGKTRIPDKFIRGMRYIGIFSIEELLNVEEDECVFTSYSISPEMPKALIKQAQKSDDGIMFTYKVKREYRYHPHAL